MEKYLYQAFALMKAGMGGEEALEKYLCYVKGLPDNYFEGSYEKISTYL